jgi:hypothetical protein
LLLLINIRRETTITATSSSASIGRYHNNRHV